MRISSGLVGLALAAGLAPGLAQAELIYGLTGDNRIVTFDSSTPGTLSSSLVINGLGGDVLTGIDLRPVNRQLYSVATNGNLYRLALDGTGGAYGANLIGNLGVGITGTGHGIDFNPVVDRLRFVSDTDLNLRINPNNAATTVDGAISGGFDIVGSAYLNSFPGTTSTALFGLDSATDQLLRTTMPNAGAYFAVGSLGIDIGGSDRVGFDISGETDAAYFNVGGQFYTLNLATGASTLVGSLGAGELVGITAAAAIPEPTTWALLIGGFGLAGAALRRRRTALA